MNTSGLNGWVFGNIIFGLIVSADRRHRRYVDVERDVVRSDHLTWISGEGQACPAPTQDIEPSAVPAQPIERRQRQSRPRDHD
ncbi:MAG: hypothetical protein U1E38_04355 [Rhodospirillales bacterium]